MFCLFRSTRFCRKGHTRDTNFIPKAEHVRPGKAANLVEEQMRAELRSECNTGESELNGKSEYGLEEAVPGILFYFYHDCESLNSLLN